MSPISPDDLHRIFKNLDRNNSGHVSIQELHRLLNTVGIHATLEELEKLVGRTSLDYLDFFFFYEAAVKARMADRDQNSCDDDDQRENDLVGAFKVFDLNNDGYISCEELQSVLSRLELWDKRSGQDCRDMIRVYDENSDGVLDFGEFKNMMSPPNTTTSDSDQT